ncbi:MAG TPA: response regulator transcription factor [Gemmataceae bacterium]|nr:response regulator transcription factor [Gemmataceae bacterium]
MTTILLADDHNVVRQGLRALLEAEPDFSVVGEAADGLEALKLVERFSPNVLILDLKMPGLNGLEVVRQTRQRRPETRIVVLSMYGDEAHVLEALRHGATAYVVKGATAADLIRGVREAVAGRHYLSPPLSEHAVEAYFARAEEAALDVYDTLTPREREVLQLAAEGLTNAEIAARLSISPRTAETHRGNLMRKLNLRTQTDLIRFALRRGIVTLNNSDPE